MYFRQRLNPAASARPHYSPGAYSLSHRGFRGDLDLRRSRGGSMACVSLMRPARQILAVVEPRGRSAGQRDGPACGGERHGPGRGGVVMYLMAAMLASSLQGDLESTR